MTDPELQSLKALRKRPVVDTSTAETIGKVDAVQVDAAGSRVIGFVIKGAASGALPLAQVQGIGPDALTVASRGAVQADGPHGVTDADALGTRVLDDGGTVLGELDDLLMAEDGSISAVVVEKQQIDTRLLGVGSYAVVVARS